MCLLEKTRSVSYTHLDVYKRQAVACVAEEEPVHAVLVAYLSVDLFGQAVDAEGIVDFVLAVRALDDEIAAPPDRDGLRLPQRIVPFAAAYHVCLLYTSRCV